MAAEAPKTHGPEDLADRLSNAMAIIGKVTYDSRNKHGGYPYASADAVYGDIRGILAEQGLVPSATVLDSGISEVSGKGKGKLWIEMKVALSWQGFDHKPEIRMQGGWLTGSQSYGSILTYAIKYWLRDVLLIPTGELDADADKQGRVNLPGKKAANGSKQDTRPEVKLASERQIAVLEEIAASEESEGVLTPNGYSLKRSAVWALKKAELTAAMAGKLIRVWKEAKGDATDQ